MRYIKSKKISEKRYELTLQVDEHDLEMMENLSVTYAPFQLYEDNKDKLDFDLSPCEFTDKYRKWIMRVWRTFLMLWKDHDD